MSVVLADTGAVIVTHRRADLARVCAELVAAEIDRSLIVVVVNDPANAPEPELEWLEANVGLVVRNESPRGYGANANEGARLLRDRCTYYLVLNDDVLPAAGTIRALRAALEDAPTAAVAAPQLIDADGIAQPIAYRFPSLGSELAAALMLPARLKRRLSGRFVLGYDPGFPVWLVGAILMVRARVFHEVGGFDERFFLYCEETDLAFRMRQRGWSAIPCESVVAVHLGAESTAGRPYRRVMGLSRWKYVQKHWRPLDRVALPPLLALAYVWNSVYVAGRIVVEPWTFRAKLSLWIAHWENRTGPRFRTMDWGADA
jgi:N-acetylglucosaminyl-diphospho-decaprenol L-rhamnosyltransferase